MNAMADALTADVPAAQTDHRVTGRTAAALDRPDPVPSPSAPPLEVQMQELEATIDARLAKDRGRTRLSRATCVRASIGVAGLALGQLSAGLL